MSAHPTSAPGVADQQVTLRLALGGARVSARLARRSALVCATLAGLVVLAGVITLAVGTTTLSVGELVDVLTGGGDRRSQLVVLGWRLPRLAFAVACGVALGLAGAVMQSLTRNPLGSPDVLGLDAGSFTGVLAVTLVAGSGSFVAIAAGSLVGGLVTAAAVYGLAYRGGVQGFRLLIVGIAVAALLASVNSALLLEASEELALAASVWAAGSLSDLGYDQLRPFLVGLVVLLPVVAWLSPSLEQGELGDAAAAALGARPERTRALATLTAVALTSLVTAVAGPIAFVALVAPQLARRLTRSAGVGLVAAATTGALLLVCADFAAARLTLPVGVVTVAVGGAFFLWLLVREYRR
ncbi:iron complex transport system permease protein [Quadrisphaera granulorum]|uniref:Iron complex transport system permease protein n=1 Tax=Quadrisphaera granulorum TaxID=317664 RepID=A0A315ZR03_9ACTN|nr:iron chelate uptake ABC transporter family permease subunit [Quadrisphaera granulorum]PWJ47712.1 iron complex transport system permease protein [Quadrisphaera granulorum]SZE98666.1 iron complex transport system permease protein [Quadrisphaera granulorum]